MGEITEYQTQLNVECLQLFAAIIATKTMRVQTRRMCWWRSEPVTCGGVRVPSALFISPVAAGHVEVSSSAEIKSPRKNRKQTQYKCLSSSAAHVHSVGEERGRWRRGGTQVGFFPSVADEGKSLTSGRGLRFHEAILNRFSVCRIKLF